MKKIFLFVSICLLNEVSGLSCPFCGCGNSNFQIGILPTFSNAFVGVRYSYSHFKTDSGSQFSRDYFHATEIWGGYKWRKVQVMAFVPYLSIHKRSDDGVINNSGIGDITLLANYLLLSKSVTASENKPYFGYALWIGGGIKLHTGQSNVDVNDPGFTIGDFTGTPGTGSTDYLLNMNYNLFVRSHGLVTNVAYKINTKNDQQYQYGNRLFLNAAYFHSFTFGSVTLRPSIGLNFVSNAANRYEAHEVPFSAGYILSGLVGFNIQRNKIGLQFSSFAPLQQDVFHGLTQMKERESVALTYSF